MNYKKNNGNEDLKLLQIEIEAKLLKVFVGKCLEAEPTMNFKWETSIPYINSHLALKMNINYVQ